ncbi:MAG: hypothetical protein STHCBS139747_004900 [Sporothrix thermara]
MLDGQQESQGDLYDAAPPPGYKRLKRVRGSGRLVREDSSTVEAASAARVRGASKRKLPVRPDSVGSEARHGKIQPTFPGDGFSADETTAKVRKTKRRTRSDNSSNSAGSGPKKRKRVETTSPVLGSLEVFTLSQAERAQKRAATEAAALASAHASSRISAVTTLIPLRPQPPAHPIAMEWEFDDSPDAAGSDDGDISVLDLEETVRDERAGSEGSSDEAAVWNTVPPLRPS